MTRSQMTDEAERRVREEIASGQDETNPAFLFQSTRTALLLAINAGLIDAAGLARRELASRGLDADGRWVGFKQAREVHGVGDGSRSENPDVDSVAEAIARRHLKIETLRSRNCDGLDFHEVSIWSLRDALVAAFEAGAREIHGLEG